MEDVLQEVKIKLSPAVIDQLERYAMAYSTTPGEIVTQALNRMFNSVVEEPQAPAIDFSEIRKKLSRP